MSDKSNATDGGASAGPAVDTAPSALEAADRLAERRDVSDAPGAMEPDGDDRNPARARPLGNAALGRSGKPDLMPAAGHAAGLGQDTEFLPAPTS